ILGIEPVQFARRLPRLNDQRLAIGESAAIRRLQKIIEINASFFSLRADQFITFSIFAGEANGVERADAECDQVVEDCARSARLAADAHYDVNWQTPRNRCVRSCRIDPEVPLETKIA